MLAVADDATTQLLGGLTTARQRQHPVEPTVQISAILRQRGVAPPVASLADGDRAQQQPFERWRKALVAAVGRVLGVAEQMSEADLPDVGVAALAAQAVGDPLHRYLREGGAAEGKTVLVKLNETPDEQASP